MRLERRGLPAVSCDVDTAVSSRASMLGLTSSRLLSPTQYRAPAGSFDLERASRGAILRWDRRRTIGGRGVKGPSVQKTRFDESPLPIFFLIDRPKFDPMFKLHPKLHKRGGKKKEREAIRQNAWTNVKLESVYCMSCMLCTVYMQHGYCVEVCIRTFRFVPNRFAPTAAGHPPAPRRP